MKSNTIPEADELLSTVYRDVLKDHHASCLHDEVYLEGFNSESCKNPYTFEKDLELARMKISLKDGPLTDDEALRLSAMNTEMDATPWMRWSLGNNARRYDFLTNN